MAISDCRRAIGSVLENVIVNLQGVLYFVGLTVGDNQIIVGDNIGDDIELVEEVLKEGFGILVSLGAVHGSDDGIASKDCRADRLEYGLTGNVGSGVEVSSADERLDAVVEIKTGADKSRGGVWEARLVRVVDVR